MALSGLERVSGCGPCPSKPAFARGAKVPWDLWVAQNQVLNRELIDWGGYEPWVIALARNQYERIEKIFDGLSWLAVGVLAPILLDKVFNRYWTRTLLKTDKAHFLSHDQFKVRLPSGAKPRYMPIGLPFELLDKAGFATRFQPGSAAMETLAQHGLKTMSASLARKILHYKLWIVWLDLVLMASKGQLYYWGKNWLTERLSGQKGFSGTFQYASEDYRRLKSAQHEKSKRRKQRLSMLISFVGTLIPPLLFGTLLKKPVAMGARNVTGQLKRVIPAFNYFNVVYMSRWLIVWHTLINWNLLGMMAARDSHERRETAIKSFTADFFFFIGDDFIAAGLARYFQKRYKNQLGGIQLTRKGLWGISHALGWPEIHAMSMKLTGEKAQKAQRLAGKLARFTFWSSMATTALVGGITLTVINNWYTRQKVMREEAALRRMGKLKSEGKPYSNTRPMWPTKPLRKGPVLKPIEALWQRSTLLHTTYLPQRPARPAWEHPRPFLSKNGAEDRT